MYVDSGGNIYAATTAGLSISTNAGASFTNITTVQGLGNTVVNGVYVDRNSNIYAATGGGLYIGK